jgi:aspartate aminotransferase-like enzyme
MFGPGDKVLACPVGVFGERFAEIVKLWGAEVEILPTTWGYGVDPAALKARLDADTNRDIKGVLLTHNETSTGVQNDMGPLADAIRAHGALALVDSVSGLGASEFTMDAWNFDVVVTASQKAMAVPPGLAMVAVSPRAWTAIEQNRGQRYYFDLLKAREYAKIGQTPATPPVSLCYALDVALDRYFAEGAASNYARYARYTQAVHAAIETLGLTLFSQPGSHSVTVSAINVPAGINGDAIRKTLRVERGFVLGGGQQKLAGKIIRIGTMGDLSQTDVLGMLGARPGGAARVPRRRRACPSVKCRVSASRHRRVRCRTNTLPHCAPQARSRPCSPTTSRASANCSRAPTASSLRAATTSIRSATANRRTRRRNALRPIAMRSKSNSCVRRAIATFRSSRSAVDCRSPTSRSAVR